MSKPETTAWGHWPSPLGPERVAAAALRLGFPQLAGEHVYWLEGRPTEGGRQVVVRAPASGQGGAEDVTPPEVNVRSRVHEYGGGDYLACADELFFADFGAGGIGHVARGRFGHVEGALRAARYADFALSPDGRWLVAVEEQAREGAEPANRLIAIDRRAGQRRVIDGEHDFVSSPAFSPAGDRLVWLAWDHPQMPWDGTELRGVAWNTEGLAGNVRRFAGGARESIFQPGFSPAGVLTFVSDRSGWWNLYQRRGDEDVPLCPREAEFGRAQWVFGMRSWAYASETRLACVRTEAGRDVLGWLDPASGRLEDVPHAASLIGALGCDGRRLVLLAAGPREAGSIELRDLASGAVEIVRREFELALEPGSLSEPEDFAFAGEGGDTAYGFLYPPRNAACVGPAGTRPPLLVRCHGGPTSAARPTLELATQFFTTRGFAVADVNYGGSTGYGRAYRERLRGRWGEVDVEDATRAALELAASGRAERARLAIRGGSAGGFTVLAALAFRDVFAAGASFYGVGDLEALLRETHKFEARYLDGLIGPWPAQKSRYRERSPVHAAAAIRAPVIFFQGEEDRVVPPGQARQMAAALEANGVSCELHLYAGEGHGFRRAETLSAALRAELAFHQRHLAR